MDGMYFNKIILAVASMEFVSPGVESHGAPSRIFCVQISVLKLLCSARNHAAKHFLVWAILSSKF